jgi:Ran GTPase-activating protein (RanGAP) involved in mRNA processing and transport
LIGWEETCRIAVLAALRDHPVLKGLLVTGFRSLAGIDVLLRGKTSQLKELVVSEFNGSIREKVVGFESFMKEMERNTTILKLAIHCVRLSRDNIQQLKAMLRRNTSLEDLNISKDALGSTGLAEVASALYRNTSIKALNVSGNGLDNLASANALRELLRRKKTIATLLMNHNMFGNNIAAGRCIADGFRTNTTLQVLDISHCALWDDALSVLAGSLGQQKLRLVSLDLSQNPITCIGLRALVDNATAVLSTVAHLNLSHTMVCHDEGATFLAETLRLKTLPSLTCL